MERIAKGIVWGLVIFGFIFGLLPWVTANTPILRQMHEVLQWHDIDPSRFYYSNVPQTLEGEWYLRGALQPSQTLEQGEGRR